MKRLARMAWIPIAVLPALLLVSLLLNPTGSFDPPWLLTLLNFVFVTAIPLLVAYRAALAYRSTGVPAVLAMGAGMLAIALASGVTPGVLIATVGSNAGVTSHNSGVLLAGICQFSAAVVGIVGLPVEHRRVRDTAIVYGAVILILGFLFALILAGATPVFFVPGQGNTPLRQIVMASAFELFVLAAVIWWQVYLRDRGALFLRWYVLGLALFAIGIAGVFESSVLGGAQSWIGRTGQYLAGLYLLGAMLAIRGKGSAEAADGWLGVRLRQSALPYKALVESTPDAVIALDRQGAVLYCNDAAHRMFGYASDEVFGRALVDLVVPASAREAIRERIAAVMPAASAAVTDGHVDLALVDRYGREFPAELTLYPIRDDAHVIVCWIRDVTAHARAEEALRASEERYRTLVEQSSEGIFVVDEAGRIVDVNNPGCRLLGYAREELVDAAWATFIPPANLAARPIPWEELRRGGTLVYERELRARDGSVLTVELANKMLAHGHVQMIARDISARKAVDVERRRLLAAIDQSRDAVMLTDPQGQILYTNRAFESISGYTADALVGRPPSIFAGPGVGPTPADMWRTVAAGEGWLGEIEALGADGRPFAAEWSISPVRDAGEAIIGHVAIARDRTAERALEAQLRQAQKMEAIGQLAGGIAHDFNNLLTAIRGYTELARRGTDADDQRRRDLDEAIANADRAAGLVGQLLAFGRRQVLQPRVLDPAAIVENMASLLRRVLGEHIELVTTVAPGLGQVKVDPTQLEQVIVNLAVNARDAMPDGGRLDIELSNVELGPTYAATHAEVVPGPYVLLAVSDAGTGIDPAVVEHIFEPFFTTKERGKGTGMGLATVYGIVKQSGGHIWVYSEPGHGSTFKVYFPRTVGSTEPALMTPHDGDVRHPARAATILLVEDEAAVREFARRALEEDGYVVLPAAGGPDALELAAAHPAPIDLLLTDVVMPGMQGHELAERLAGLHPEMRVLYISGFTENSVITRGVVRAGVAFLAKPFSGESLCAAVRAALQGGAERPG